MGIHNSSSPPIEQRVGNPITEKKTQKNQHEGFYDCLCFDGRCLSRVPYRLSIWRRRFLPWLQCPSSHRLHPPCLRHSPRVPCWFPTHHCRSPPFQEGG